MSETSTETVPAPAHLAREPNHSFSDSRRYIWHATLLLICVAAFFVTALISVGIFERIPHVEDEAAYLFQAQVFAQGQLSVPTPPHPTSYWSPFVLDYQGRRFGKYPPGYPLLLSLGVLAGAPWVVNALLASLTLWVLAYAGRVIYSPAAGLLAAALGLTVPVFLAMSGTLLSHPTSLLFTTVFLWAFASLSRLDFARPGLPNPGENGDSLALPAPALPRPAPAGCRHRASVAIPSERTSNLQSLVQRPADSSRRRYAIVAGLALGCLFVTRPFDAIGVSFPFALYVPIRGLRGDRALLRQAMVIAAIVAIFGLLTLAYWYGLAGTIGNPYTLLWPYDRPGFGPNFGPEGYTLATGLRYLRSNLRDLATSFLGWPGYLNVLFLLLSFILRPRDRWNYLLLTSFLSLALLHVSYWYYGGRDAGFPRYYYAALPMLLLLTIRGIELSAAALRRFLHARFPYGESASDTNLPITNLPIYLILIGLVLYNGLAFLPPNLRAFQGKSGITAEPLHVIQDAGVTDVIVFVTDVELWYDFAVFFSVNSPTLDSDVVYAIYHNRPLAQAVKDLFPNRKCYVQSEAQLRPCPF